MEAAPAGLRGPLAKRLPVCDKFAIRRVGRPSLNPEDN